MNTPHPIIGLNSTSFLFQLGDDSFGHSTVQNFKDNGINVWKDNCWV